MKDVPNWQLLVVLYIFVVAVPVIFLNKWLKKKLLAGKSLQGLLIYFCVLALTAFVLHSTVMWLYYSFLFTVKK